MLSEEKFGDRIFESSLPANFLDLNVFIFASYQLLKYIQSDIIKHRLPYVWLHISKSLWIVFRLYSINLSVIDSLKQHEIEWYLMVSKLCFVIALCVCFSFASLSSLQLICSAVSYCIKIKQVIDSHWFYYTPANFVCGGVYCFTLSIRPSVRPSVRPCVRPWHFGFFLISWKRSNWYSSISADTLILIRCTYIRKSKGYGPILLQLPPFVNFLNAVLVCVHTIFLANGRNLTKLAQIYH